LNPQEICKNIENKCGAVISTGRGSAFEIICSNKNIILREYLRGGLLRQINSNFFFSKQRFLDEYNILEYLISNKFPTAIPMFTVYRKSFFLYNGFLGTKKIENTINFYEAVKASEYNLKKTPLEICIETLDIIFELHKLKIYNPDIHIKNILVDKCSEKIFIIDFDKSVKNRNSVFDFFAMAYRYLRSIKKLNANYNLFNEKEFTCLIKKINCFYTEFKAAAFICRYLFLR